MLLLREFSVFVFFLCSSITDSEFSGYDQNAYLRTGNRDDSMAPDHTWNIVLHINTS